MTWYAGRNSTNAGNNTGWSFGNINYQTISTSSISITTVDKLISIVRKSSSISISIFNKLISIVRKSSSISIYVFNKKIIKSLVTLSVPIATIRNTVFALIREFFAIFDKPITYGVIMLKNIINK